MASHQWIDVDVPPDAFAVVMATGIVSIAAQDHDYSRLGRPLAGLATAALILLSGRVMVRALGRRVSPFGRLRDPDVALRLFTFVAACDVLGARFVDHPDVVRTAGVLAAAAWLVVVAVCGRAMRGRSPATLRDAAHGAWLLASVATAGLAITASDLLLPGGWSGWAVLSAIAWILALALYLVITLLIVWRAVTTRFVPDLVAPDSWILMGALAIATLAGARLLAATRAAGSLPWLVDASRPAITVLWVLASLWIPALLYASVWRADRRPGSLQFAGVWWSAVFPLGMYSAATHATAVQLHIRSLRTISLIFFWVAFTVWLFVALGWLRSLIRTRGPGQTGSTGRGSTAPARRLRRNSTRRVPST